MCPRVIFNPGIGPGRYWTDGNTNTRPISRLKTSGWITQVQTINTTEGGYHEAKLKSPSKNHAVQLKVVGTNEEVGSVKAQAGPGISINEANKKLPTEEQHIQLKKISSNTNLGSKMTQGQPLSSNNQANLKSATGDTAIPLKMV